jgi:hypothetical protein
METETISLERLTVAVSTRMRKELVGELKAYQIEDLMADQLYISLRYFIYGQDEKEVLACQVPANWWEHFKERWLPWLKVKYKKYGLSARVVYPMLDIGLPKEKHVVMLRRTEEGEE